MEKGQDVCVSAPLPSFALWLGRSAVTASAAVAAAPGLRDYFRLGRV